MAMAPEPVSTDKRHWWESLRVQGFAMTALGVAMLFNPLTNPHAGWVISTGATWMTAGAASKAIRDKSVKNILKL
jgi:uncharacterized membrane protein HdeD (DUF308 family)